MSETAPKISVPRQVGSIMIVIGTEVGAGMLALPIITAKLGFITGTLTMLAAWLIMTYTAILIADIALGMPRGTSFAMMARTLLGRAGAVTAWVSFLMLMYTISVAYISAAGSTFNHLIPAIPLTVWSIVFVAVFALIVLTGTRAVDWLNRLLLTAKLIFLLLACFALLPLVVGSNLLVFPHELEVMIIAIPVMVTSFTSHIIVPTLTDYLHKDKRVVFRVLVIGSLIPLLLYCVYLVAILGVLPLTGKVSFMSSVFQHQSETSANIGEVLTALSSRIQAGFVMFNVNAFTNIAVMTSYLGVGLSLYHFNIDSYRLGRFRRVPKCVLGILLTFLLPLIVAITDKDLFVDALGYVGVCIAVLLMIMPGLMAIRLGAQRHHYHYRITAVPTLWYVAIAAGIAVIVIKFMGT